MGSTVKQEGKYQYKYAPEPSYTSRMAGNVITIPSEVGEEVDPRKRYRSMSEQPFGQQTLATEQPPVPQEYSPQQQQSITTQQQSIIPQWGKRHSFTNLMLIKAMEEMRNGNKKN